MKLWADPLCPLCEEGVEICITIFAHNHVVWFGQNFVHPRDGGVLYYVIQRVKVCAIFTLEMHQIQWSTVCEKMEGRAEMSETWESNGWDRVSRNDTGRGGKD